MDATSQAEAVRRGDVSARELVDVAIAGIERLNPTLNAVIHERFERARTEADVFSCPDAPFAGVPFLVKDLIAHSAGDPFHEGIKTLADRGFVEETDTDLVTRFGAAGLITVGRTNTSELGLLPGTEPVSYGPTRNPWDLQRTPLGSGGGSAAAAAAGFVAVAHSNDGGGSIRLPASACGLVGLKPSRGRVTLGPDFGDLARHDGSLFDARRSPGALRVGFMTSAPVTGDVHPDCVDAVHATARLLADLGHHVVESHPVALDDEGFARQAMTLMPLGFAAFALDWWERRTGIKLGPDDLEPFTWMCAERGRRINAGQYLSSVEWIQAWSRRMATWWSEGFDLLLTPTVPVPPPLLGTLTDPADPRKTARNAADICAFTYPFNMTGQPAISLPLHLNSDRLPIGSHLVAAAGREDLILRAAWQLEQTQPWIQQRPPNHVLQPT